MKSLSHKIHHTVRQRFNSLIWGKVNISIYVHTHCDIYKRVSDQVEVEVQAQVLYQLEHSEEL